MTGWSQELGASFYLLQFCCFIRLVSILQALIKMNCSKVFLHLKYFTFSDSISVWCLWWWAVRDHWTMSSSRTNLAKKRRKSRRGWRKKHQLCTEDREFLVEATNFTLEEITEWYKWVWGEQCDDSHLTNYPVDSWRTTQPDSWVKRRCWTCTTQSFLWARLLNLWRTYFTNLIKIKTER